MPKHFFFDLDETLTPSKSLIEPHHVPILRELCSRVDVTVVSGHGAKDIVAHLRPDLEGLYNILGQNGNFAQTRDGAVLWNRSLTPEQKDAILTFIAKARAHLNYTVRDENDIIEDRDSQIAFSLIGHHEDKNIKRAFDPDRQKRRALLSDLKEEVERLRLANVEITIGGSTNLDIYQLGKHKGYNIAAFIDTMKWKREDSLYIGDALVPGGNDETVIGVIPTHSVKDYNETYSYLNEIMLKS
jgi:phosphomannomutase